MNELTRVESFLVGGEENWRGLKNVSIGTKIKRPYRTLTGKIIEIEKTVARILRDDNDVHMVIFEPYTVPEEEE